MIKIAICDDEELFCASIKENISQYMCEKKLLSHIDIYNSGKQLLEVGKAAYEYDIYFLDVSMGELSGIDVAKKIREYNEVAQIAFITAYIDYSTEGYKVNAIRYIIKDINGLEASLYECLDCITNKIKDIEKDKYMKFIEGEKLFNISELLYIESNLRKLEFHMQDGKIYSVYGKLDEIEAEYNDRQFVRIQQSFLVNLAHVSVVGAGNIIMDNGAAISISRNRLKDVRTAFIKSRGNI